MFLGLYGVDPAAVARAGTSALKRGALRVFDTLMPRDELRQQLALLAGINERTPAKTRCGKAFRKAPTNARSRSLPRRSKMTPTIRPCRCPLDTGPTIRRRLTRGHEPI